MYQVIYSETRDCPAEVELHEAYKGEINHTISEAMVDAQDVVHSVTAIDDISEDDIVIDVLEVLTPVQYSALTELFSTGMEVTYQQVIEVLTENGR